MLHCADHIIEEPRRRVGLEHISEVWVLLVREIPESEGITFRFVLGQTIASPILSPKVHIEHDCQNDDNTVAARSQRFIIQRHPLGRTDTYHMIRPSQSSG